MNFKYIYRVESAKGEGPYRNNNFHFNTSYDNNIRPTPYRDEGILTHFNGRSSMCDATLRPYRCGFISMKSLLNWFDIRALKKLDRYNFKIGIYAIPIDDIVIGERQVLFRRRKNTIISKIPLQRIINA